MNYIALSVRDYGLGRICITADRLSNILNPQSYSPISFSRKLLEYVGQKSIGEKINLGIVNSSGNIYSNSFAKLSPIYFKEIDLQDISIEALEQYDILYFMGLPALVSSIVKTKIESYVRLGGNMVIEVPDRGEENINVLSNIENIYCSSYSNPVYTKACWTVDGFQNYMFNSEVKWEFLTTLEYKYFSSAWTILLSDVETTVPYIQQTQTLATVGTIGTIGSEFGVSYYSSMKNGIAIIEEGGSTSSSSSFDITSSSSSSSLYDDTEWNICYNMHAQWKMNDNSNSSIIWNEQKNMRFIGMLKSNLTNISTSTKHVSGKIDGAISFDGITNYVSIPSNTYFNFSHGYSIGDDDPFSVSLWIKPLSVETINDSFLIDKTNTWSIYLNNGKVIFNLTDYLNSGYMIVESLSNVIQINQWNNIIITYDAIDISGISIYVNGVKVTSSNSQLNYSSMNMAESTMTFAANYNYDKKFYGYLDNIIVVNKKLNEIEVEGLYNRNNGTESCNGIFKYTSSSSSLSSESSESSSSSIDSNSSSTSSLSSSSSSSSENYSYSSSSSSNIYSSSSESSFSSLSSLIYSSSSESSSESSGGDSESSSESSSSSFNYSESSSISSIIYSSSSSSYSMSSDFICNVLSTAKEYISLDPCENLSNIYITGVTNNFSIGCTVYGNAYFETKNYSTGLLQSYVRIDLFNNINPFSQAIGYIVGQSAPYIEGQTIIFRAYVYSSGGSGIGGYVNVLGATEVTTSQVSLVID